MNPAQYYINNSIKTEDGRKTVISKLNQFAAVLLNCQKNHGEIVLNGKPVVDENKLFLKVDWNGLNRIEAKQVITYFELLDNEFSERVYASSTIKAMLSHVKGVVKIAHEELETFKSEKDYSRIISMKPPKGNAKPKREVPAKKVFRKILRELHKKGDLISIRNALMIALLVLQGLRKAELRLIKLSDIHLDSGIVEILGKGNKYRIVNLSDESIALIKEWLKHRGKEPGYLIKPMVKGGNFSKKNNPISGWSVWNIVKTSAEEIAKQSGVAAHDLRRAFATYNLENGTDLQTVQLLMGHSDPSTTAIYVRNEEERKRKARNVVSLGIK